MIYIKNTITNEIEQLSQLSSIPSSYYGTEKETFINENGITCQRAKLKNEYILLTENDLEVQEQILLPKIKEKQIALIKEARDQEMDKDHFTTDAFILEKTNGSLGFVFDENGEKVRKQFKFNLKSGKSSINQPDVIITRVLIKSLNDPSYHLRYSCKFIDDTEGYVVIDREVATIISDHLEDRGTTAVFLANELEEEINSIFISETKTFEEAKAEIEAITLT
jgi:hypothetical protein